MNTNTFYISALTNTITRQNATDTAQSTVKKFLENIPQNAIYTGKDIPTGKNIIVLSSIVSQHYEAGTASRNAYKYDQKWWDFSDYNHNPIIAWQHNYSYGAIGHAIAFWNDSENNLNSLFYIDLSTLEKRHAKQIKNGYTTGISTGAMTVEYMFEDKTGKRYTEDEAKEAFSTEDVFYAFYGMNDKLTLVITKAKMLENSIVTIGSNEKAVAQKNSLEDFFHTEAEKLNYTPQNSLHLNDHIMPKNHKTVETEAEAVVQNQAEAEANNAEDTAESTPEAETPTSADENTETVNTDAPTNDLDPISVLKNEIQALKDALVSQEKAHNDALKQLQAEYDQKLQSAISAEINKIRTTQRDELAKVVQNNNINKADTIDGFMAKYSK